MSSSARAMSVSRATGAQPSREAQTRAQGRVLFVAEGAEACAPYVRMLEDAGFSVVDVAGAMRARVRFRETRPHVVVIATDLRGMSHTELARMLLTADAGVSMIFVGADEAIKERRAEALACGPFGYFRLPAEADLLAGRVGQLVELKNQIEVLRAAADCDYLTGLANRRRFRAALGQEVERFRRYRVPCALLLLDIDFLKRINDTHGHSAGDAAIRHVADLLQEFSRDNDTPARLGGEEFALLLAGVADAQALVVAERVRQGVCAAPIEVIGTVSVSIGVAACPVHAATERLLYSVADAALYRAKQNGRDRCELAMPAQ